MKLSEEDNHGRCLPDRTLASSNVPARRALVFLGIRRDSRVVVAPVAPAPLGVPFAGSISGRAPVIASEPRVPCASRDDTEVDSVLIEEDPVEARVLVEA